MTLAVPDSVECQPCLTGQSWFRPPELGLYVNQAPVRIREQRRSERELVEISTSAIESDCEDLVVWFVHATSSDPNSHTAVYGSIGLIARWTTSSASVGGIAEQPALHASVAGHGRLPYAPAVFVLVAVVGFADGRTAAQRG